MKAVLIILIIVLTSACSKKHDAVIFNGFWAIHRVCENGEIIKPDVGLVRIENDTLINFPLGNFESSFCFMESSKDSLILDRTCGIVRFKYEFNSKLDKIKMKNTNRIYQFERIDSNDLTIRKILKKTGVKIDLPKSKSKIKADFSNPRIIYIGEEIPYEYPLCPEELTSSDLILDDFIQVQESCLPPFQLPTGIILKYGSGKVHPCELTELKSVFLNEIGDLEKIDLILCADKNITPEILLKIKSEFIDSRIEISQMKISETNKLELRYD